MREMLSPPAHSFDRAFQTVYRYEKIFLKKLLTYKFRCDILYKLSLERQGKFLDNSILMHP